MQPPTEGANWQWATERTNRYEAERKKEMVELTFWLSNSLLHTVQRWTKLKHKQKGQTSCAFHAFHTDKILKILHHRLSAICCCLLV